MTSKAATVKVVVAGGAVPPAGSSKEEVMSMEEIMRARHFATALGIDVVVIGTSPSTEKAITQAIETGAITEVAAEEEEESK